MRKKERIRKIGRLMSVLASPYTAVSTKVVKKSVHDNAERKAGKYPVNFNKSSESNIAAFSRIR